MKPGITYVDREKLIEVAIDVGLTITPQAGWIRIGSMKDSEPRVYVKTSKRVGEVHVSALKVPPPAGSCLPFSDPRFGQVNFIVDQTNGGQDDVLRRLRLVLEHIRRLLAKPGHR